MGKYIKNRKDENMSSVNDDNKDKTINDAGDEKCLTALFQDTELKEKVVCELNKECNKKETYSSLLKKGTGSFLESLIKAIKGKDLL